MASRALDIPDPSQPASTLPPPSSSKNATACAVRTLSASPTTIRVGALAPDEASGLPFAPSCAAKRYDYNLLPSYSQPTPGAGASTVSTWPVRAPSAMLVVPCHSVAIMNSVLLLAPPSAQAKHPRSRSIVCSTSPPSLTRTQRLLGTSPYQTAFSASRQMPSGTPLSRSAHTRRFDRLPSAAMSKAVSFLP